MRGQLSHPNRNVLRKASYVGIGALFGGLIGASLLQATAVRSGEPMGEPMQAVPYALAYSTATNRTGATSLDGATVGQTFYAFLTPATADISRVRFWLDDPAMSSTPRQTENSTPYDFAGGTVAAANPFDTRTLRDGSHTITAGVEFSDGRSVVVHAVFTVNNGIGSTLPRKPDQIHLSWLADPATTMMVVWRTLDTTTASELQLRRAGEPVWQSVSGARRSSATRGTLHQAALVGLASNTPYEYRVLGDGGAWSDVHTFVTAPTAGPADFTAAFVADTGLIGRADGLATGTGQVRDEIAKLKPTLTLLGGDYVYYNTDKRYGSLNESIDVWFNQMQPVGAISPLMPTYGNHEALLGEGLEHWFPRFVHPSGYDGQRFYSFDVADVHFVSILAVSDTTGIPSGALAWIDQDMAAARARGQRWIVPYFHAVAFGDGTNHKSNPELRRQFGPIFEKHDVKIALYTHDQAYERSFPLTGVPDAISITSTDQACYGPSDGVTWVKTSPGGKMSNISRAFSPFAHSTPPFWTAYRNNTIHNFGRLVFSSNGTARYEAYGVVGDGTPPLIIDSFEYRLETSCPPALKFGSPEVTMSVSEGQVATRDVSVEAANGAQVQTSLEETAPWLTLSAGSLTTPASVRLTARPDGLVPGSYSTLVGARAIGFADAVLRVTMVVSGEHRIYVSASPARTNPALLNGATAADDIYVFTLPTEQVTRVEFYVDNPSLSGTPDQVEGNAPYDLAGTRTDGTAYPFDTTDLPDGPHTVSARITRSVGAVVIAHATFTVANDAPPSPALVVSPSSLSFSMDEGSQTPAPQQVSVGTTDGQPASFSASSNAAWLRAQGTSSAPGVLTVQVDPAGLPAGTYTGTIALTSGTHTGAAVQAALTIRAAGGPSYALLYSTTSNRSNPKPLGAATVSGRMYAFTSPDTPNIRRVLFWLDNTAMSGSPRRTENTAPYDFAGGDVATATSFNTGNLTNGSHTISARMELTDGSFVIVHATFTVAN